MPDRAPTGKLPEGALVAHNNEILGGLHDPVTSSRGHVWRRVVYSQRDIYDAAVRGVILQTIARSQ
jgi:hypothetical protein